jgi:chromosome segregation ATPase
MAVSDNERKIDNLRRENEQWREKLHELQMQADSDEQKKALTPELNSLDQKTTKLRKQLEKAEELNKKVQLVNDQVTTWTMKIVQKIDQQFNDNIH